MNQNELLLKISKYLARFKEQVKILNADGDFSINKQAENVLIDVLSEIFDCYFENVNYSESNTYPSIDLRTTNSSKNKIAIQITSISNIEKVKHSIHLFIKNKLYESFDELYVFILSDKQNSYTQSILDSIVDNRFRFNAKKHILDLTDIRLKLSEGNKLDKIRRVSNLLEKQFSDYSSLDEENYKNFFKSYQESVSYLFSKINFLGLALNNKPREVDFFSLFVSPKFIVNNPTYISPIDDKEYIKVEPEKPKFIFSFTYDYYELLKKMEFAFLTSITDYEQECTPPILQEILTLHRLFNLQKNIVILGKAGLGKSSTIKYIIHKVLESDKDVFENKKIYDFIPFRIELHKYNKDKKQLGLNIHTYLQSILEREYQVHSLDKEFIDNILLYKKVIIFFDGLDEIFDNQERLELRNDIELFAKKNQEIKIIVTSRQEAYQISPFDSNLFEVVEIKEFDNEQVLEYLHKWYSIEEIDDLKRVKEIEDCSLQLTRIDNELKCNPLILSLILILYRNEQELPTSKLDIYESCTNTLVETRDFKEKKLSIKLRISNNTATFSALAFWQYINLSENKPIDYNSAKQKIKNYLLEKGDFDDDNEAEIATDDFFIFAQNRSIYIDNNFTHKTFLEYFTAYYLFANFHNKPNNHHKRDDIIIKYLGNPFWDVVFELLICKIDKNQPDFEVIDGLIDLILKQTGSRGISFLLRVINYLKNISSKKISIILSKAIEECITTNGDNFNIFENLVIHGSSNDSFENLINKEIDSKIVLYKNNNSITDNLSVFILEYTISTKNPLYITDKLINTPQKNPYFYILLNYNRLQNWNDYFIFLKDFRKKFSVKECIKTYKSVFKSNILLDNNINLLLYPLFHHNNKQLFVKHYHILMDLGFSFSDISKAINRSKFIYTIPFSEDELRKISKNIPNLKGICNVLLKAYYSNDIDNVNYSNKYLTNKI